MQTQGAEEEESSSWGTPNQLQFIRVKELSSAKGGSLKTRRSPLIIIEGVGLVAVAVCRLQSGGLQC